MKLLELFKKMPDDFSLLNPHGSDETYTKLFEYFYSLFLLNPHGSDETRREWQSCIGHESTS